MPAVRRARRGARARPDPAHRLPVLRLAARRHAGPRGARGARAARRSSPLIPLGIEGPAARRGVDGHRRHGAQRHRRGRALSLARVPPVRAAARLPLAGRGQGPLVVRRAARRGRRRRSARPARATAASVHALPVRVAAGRPRAGRVLLGGGARRRDGDRRLRRARRACCPKEERRTSEITWSLGTYTEPDEVWKAFGSRARRRSRRASAPHQPWPWRGPRGRSSTSARSSPWPRSSSSYFVFLIVVGGKTVHREAVDIPPGGGARRAGGGRLRRAVLRDRATATSQVKVHGAGEQLLALPGRRADQRGDGRGRRVRRRGLVLLRHRQRRLLVARAAPRRRATSPRVPPGPLHAAAGAAVGAGQRAAGSYDAHGDAAACRASTSSAGRCWPSLAWPVLAGSGASSASRSARWSESDHPWIESSDDEDETTNEARLHRLRPGSCSALWALAAWQGLGAARGRSAASSRRASARRPGGYRSYNYWRGGK